MYLYTVELERVYLYSVRKGQTAVALDSGLYELEKSRRRLYNFNSSPSGSATVKQLGPKALVFNWSYAPCATRPVHNFT